MSTILSLPSEKRIKQKICRQIFGSTSLVKCPYCQKTGCIRRNEKFQCKRCGKAWSLTSLTWMKGMKFDLDFVWISNDKVVEVTQDILKPAPDISLRDLLRFGPKQSVEMVLEVKADKIWRGEVKNKKNQLVDTSEYFLTNL